jgi:outer membrane protein assembly factor BamA
LTPWRLGVGLFLLLALAGCDHPARVAGSTVSEGDLLEVARRPIEAWLAQGRRPADLVDAGEAMRALLDSRGLPWARVTAIPPGSEQGELLFVVEEGPLVRIGTITLSGDPGLPEADLVTAAGLGPNYATAAINAAPAQMRRRLRAAGYLTAQVAAPAVVWAEGRGRADLTFAVTAGKRLLLLRETVVVAEGPADLAARLEALLDPPGTPCHPRLGEEAAARLRGWLVERGHRAAAVEVRQRIDATGSGLEVELDVRPGPLHVVGAVTVEGGARSAPGFVQRHLRALVPGQPLAQGAVDRAASSLSATGIYRSVQPVVTPGDARADGAIPTDVAVKLAEEPTQRIDVAIGWGSYERLRGGVRYFDEHLFGQGLHFDAGAQVSMKGWDASIGVADPVSFGPGRRLGLDLAVEERQEPSYAHREASLTLSFAQRFRLPGDRALYEARPYYRFTGSEDFRVDAEEPYADEPERYSTSMVGLDCKRDGRRPKQVDPETGTLTRLGAAWSAKPLGAQVAFTELRADWSGTQQVAPWLVGSLRAGAATRQPQGSDDLPIGERLFLGGADSVRSFTKDDLGPRDPDGQPLGGLTSAVASCELRLRPFARRRELEFAAFYDIGMVATAPFRIEGPAGQAVGGGLRYRLPVGPIRLDYGYNPGNRLGARHPWALHLAMGFAF